MKKMRWFGKFCCAFAAMALASLSVMGCDLEVDDKDNRAALVSSFLYVGLGGENTFNISSVKVGDTEQAITHATLAPSLWNAISEFETVKLPEGSSVSYTFKQADVGSDNYKTWAIAVYDNATISSANGTFLRGDNWLNKSTDAGFAAGLWSDGGVTAGGTYSNDFTYETAGKSLTSSNTVVVKVEYSGSTVTITETVDGKLAYTTTGTISSSPDDNTTTDNTNTENKNDENKNDENDNSGTGGSSASGDNETVNWTKVEGTWTAAAGKSSWAAEGTIDLTAFDTSKGLSLSFYIQNTATDQTCVFQTSDNIQICAGYVWAAAEKGNGFFEADNTITANTWEKACGTHYETIVFNTDGSVDWYLDGELTFNWTEKKKQITALFSEIKAAALNILPLTNSTTDVTVSNISYSSAVTADEAKSVYENFSK